MSRIEEKRLLDKLWSLLFPCFYSIYPAYPVHPVIFFNLVIVSILLLFFYPAYPVYPVFSFILCSLYIRSAAKAVGAIHRAGIIPMASGTAQVFFQTFPASPPKYSIDPLERSFGVIRLLY